MGYLDEPLLGAVEYLKNRRPFQDRASEKAVDKAKAWVDECETKHPHCRKVVTSSLPSRVLDLFHTGSSQKIGLVEGKGLDAAYITLSHCWGKEVEDISGQ
jgi:hypothetical protein